MKNILFALLLVSSALLMGCGSNEPKAGEGETSTTTAPGEVDYDKMADGFCSCMRPMFDFQEKVMKLAEDGKNDEIEALRDQAIKVQEDGASCIASLEAKYGVVEGVEAEAKATAALEKKCPDIMGMMGAAAEPFEE